MTSDDNDRRDGSGSEEETLWSFALLPGPGGLPGGPWAIAEERSWPTGRLDPESEKSRRALRAGGVTAWRKLEEGGTSRSAWFEVVPYSCAEDAALSLLQLPQFFVGGSQPDDEVIGERVLHDREVPGLPDPWILQKSTRGPRGEVEAHAIAGAIGPLLSITSFSGRVGDWPWSEIIRLTGAQADRVRLTLVDSGDPADP